MLDPGTIVGNILGSPEFTALLISALTTILAATGSAVLWVVRTYILGGASEKRRQQILEAARIGVMYAEQTGLAAAAEEKLDLALEAAAAQLQAWGVKNVSANDLRYAIEAALYKMKAEGAIVRALPVEAPQG